MKIDTKRALIFRPESAEEVSKYARRALRAASAIGELPTPIDNLLAAAKVGNLKIDEDVKERFFASLTGPSKQAFETMWQKVRGIADLRKRVTYVDENTSQPRILFAKGHELGHSVLPWHTVDPVHLDDEKSLNYGGLTYEGEEILEAEASFFSAEVLFQGENFARIVRDYTVQFDSIFHIAEMHGASRHATAWRYVEEQDEAVALLAYWPDKFKRGTLYCGKVVASPKFLRKFSLVDIPQHLTQDHAWMAACDSGLVLSEMISMDCDGGSSRFGWEAWWNGYALLVMLHRKPTLHLVRDFAETLSVAARR